ncbi:MAG: fumarylacetoacetate hydrolase family protein [Planktotalea sp.]|uniref:fumarylacetoacetate hydrolase family protein n=1 Tax=Planktotalea sp. TaxID=2029877 RepID=UPI003C726F9B
MTDFLFPIAPTTSIRVDGESAAFPINRIFCVGRNYAAHAAEMGNVPDYEAPFYFTKAAQHAVASGARIPYPLGTENYHHEMELTVLIGAPAFRISQDDALSVVYGYCASLDMTRRDLQNASKDKRRPWDTSKDFENAAVFGVASKAEAFGEIADQRIALSVNGAARQDASLAELIHSVPAIIADLSALYHLQAGDVIMTGTPAGVGPVGAGDVLHGSIDGLAPVELTITQAE